MSLSNSSLPYKGVVQITTDSGTKNACWQSLDSHARNTVCRQLGYLTTYSVVNVPVPTDAKDATFSGRINCNSQRKYLSQCSITPSAIQTCSELSYMECKCGITKLIYIQGVQKFFEGYIPYKVICFDLASLQVGASLNTLGL